MKISFIALTLLFIASVGIMSCGELHPEEFHSIERNGVIHNFTKSSIPWIDNFIKNNFREWENDTFEIFNQVKDSRAIAIDLGAWIGTTAVWLSKNFAHVVAVEADKESVFYLEKNLQASDCDNVVVCPYAVTDKDKLLYFGPRLSMNHGDALNGSTSFAKDQKDSVSDYAIEGFSFSNIMSEYVEKRLKASLSEISFIKCDIEGGEELILHDVLAFAATYGCKVWMSFHLPWWKCNVIQDFEEEFKKFNVNIGESIFAYLEKNPFGSILFTPKQDPQELPSECVFSEIYEQKIWGTNDQGQGWSGGGSSYESTKEYRLFLQNFLKEYDIKTVVDLGCGDWEFSKYLDWSGIQYLGLDVVESVIQKNKVRYETDSIKFEQWDALNNELPSGQLLICKDVLQHLTNEDILLLCKQFCKFKYCLITNGIDAGTNSSDNRTIKRGEYRPLDISKPPFNVKCKKVLKYQAGNFAMQTILIEN